VIRGKVPGDGGGRGVFVVFAVFVVSAVLAPGGFDPQGGDEFRTSIQFGVAVVKAGNHKRGKFQKDPMTAGGADKIQYGLQVSPQDVPVAWFGKTLEVDIGGVNEGQNPGGFFRAHTAVAYQYIGKAPFTGQFHAIFQILNVDKGFRIRVGNLPGAAFRRKGGQDICGVHPAARRRSSLKLGDVPVLAEGAAQVTARETQGKHTGTGTKVVQGLFFDGINGGGGDVPVEGQGQFPGIHRLPDAAKTPAPGRN
jgi:hypothetical protein